MPKLLDHTILFSVAFSLLLFFPVPASAAVPGDGDLNGDGMLTAADRAVMLDYLLGKKSLNSEQLLHADLNGDGRTDIADFLWMLDPLPKIESFAINGGAASAQSRTVTLDNVCKHATNYIASESSNFSGTTWQTYSTAPSFTIASSGNGTKTVWFKVKNQMGESARTSDTIVLNESSDGSIDMVSVEAGTFTMGRTDAGDDAAGSSDELPRHQVTLSAYQIGKYEVTNGQFAAVLNWAKGKGYLKNYSGNVYDGGDIIYAGRRDLIYVSEPTCQIQYFGGSFTWKTRTGANSVSYSMEKHPVGDVTWYGCVAFCNWLSEKEGKTPAYDLSTWALVDANASAAGIQFTNGYRLPTEAEWERAAAWDGSKHWIYGFLSDTLTGKDRCNYRRNYPFYEVNPMGIMGTYDPPTSPIGWFNGVNVSPNGSVQTINSPSPVGCYDMSGNASEWCHDWFGSYDSGSTTNPTGQVIGSSRMVRGGGWVSGGNYCRSAFRDSNHPDTWSSFIGFRLARTN